MTLTRSDAPPKMASWSILIATGLIVFAWLVLNYTALQWLFASFSDTSVFNSIIFGVVATVLLVQAIHHRRKLGLSATPRLHPAPLILMFGSTVTGIGLQWVLDIPQIGVLLFADSGKQAIREVALVCPDLVLMDICLKGKMDGIQASAKIWDEFKVPVIYLTANSAINTIQQAKNTAPFGYITKPFDERELHITIEIALHRHKLEKQLKEREQWLETVLASLGDAVIAIDDKSCITLLNPVAEALTGWKQKDAFGRNAAEILHIIDAETRIQIDSPLAEVLQGGVTISLPGQTILINKDSSEIPIDDSTAPIKNDQGKIRGAVIVFRDITERKLAEGALRDSEKRLSWQVSHDLLTGLIN